jgi:hypothetical protein
MFTVGKQSLVFKRRRKTRSPLTSKKVFVQYGLVLYTGQGFVLIRTHKTADDKTLAKIS